MSGYLWRGKPDLERLNAAIMAARSGDRAPNSDLFQWGRAFGRGNTRLRAGTGKPAPAAVVPRRP